MGNSCTDCFVVTMLASLLSNEAPRLGAQYHNTLPRPSNLLSATWHQPGEWRSGDYFPQCMRSPHDVITEKAPTSRAFSWMKAATTLEGAFSVITNLCVDLRFKFLNEDNCAQCMGSTGG